MLDRNIYFRKCIFTRLTLALDPSSKHYICWVDQGAPCWAEKPFQLMKEILRVPSQAELKQQCLLTSVKDWGSKIWSPTPSAFQSCFEFPIITALLPNYLHSHLLCVSPLLHGTYQTTKLFFFSKKLVHLFQTAAAFLISRDNITYVEVSANCSL